MNSIISVENLSKQYRIGTKLPYKTFRETLMNVITSPAKLFKSNGSRENNTIWALKDVSFDVQQGEILGMRKEEIKKKFDVSSDYLMIE